MKVYYYIAYGSNLNLRQMSYRCQDARLMATGILKNYELLFRGRNGICYCTIEPHRGMCVPIGIFEVSERDRQCLDRYEGYPTHYKRISIKPTEVELFTCERMQRSMFVYVMNKNIGQLGYPSQHYWDVVRQGYYDCGLDERYLQQALYNSTNRQG